MVPDDLAPLTDAELSALEHNIGRLRAGREVWDSPLPFTILARTIALGPTPRLVAEVRRLRAENENHRRAWAAEVKHDERLEWAIKGLQADIDRLFAERDALRAEASRLRKACDPECFFCHQQGRPWK